MRIIFLNSWYGKAGESYFRYIVSESQRTDIFCFQEVSPDLFGELERILSGHVGEYQTENKLEILGNIYGKAVFVSRDMEFTSSDKLMLYETGGHNMGFASPFEVKTDGAIININSIHGITLPANKLDTSERIQQSQTIIDYFKDKKGPKIIGGDFNLMPNTESVKMFEAAGYRDLIKEYGIRETRNRLTWEFFKGNPNFVKQHFADFVFVSSEIKILNFEVPQNEVSDHLPLVLDFEI